MFTLFYSYIKSWAVRAVSLLCWRLPPVGLRSHRQPRGFVLRRVAVLQTPARCQPPTSGEALPTQVDAQRPALPGNGFISARVCVFVSAGQSGRKMPAASGAAI